jgi:hypothetical protein
MKRKKKDPEITAFDDMYNKKLVVKLYQGLDTNTLIATKFRVLFGKRGVADKSFVARMTKYYLDYARKTWAQKYVQYRFVNGRIRYSVKFPS